MNVFVTGRAGFIGSHTCVELLQAGYEVVVLDNFSKSRPEVLPLVEQIAGRKLPFVQGDIRNQSAIEAALPDINVGAGRVTIPMVITMAILKNDGCITKPKGCMNSSRNNGIQKMTFWSKTLQYLREIYETFA